MKTPLILFAVSACVTGLGYLFPAWSDLLLLGIPCSIASLWLIWRGWLGGDQTPVQRLRPSPTHRPKRVQRVDLHKVKPPREEEINAQNWVIVDGSNVMHWIDNEPNIQPVRDVLAHLTQLGYTAGVMFDASAGHRLQGKYWHDDAFSRLLGIPEDRIMVVPKGTIADKYILTAARDFRAKIVTNDRFRDWADAFPEVHEFGFLITGWYRDGKLFTSLELEA
ncbi:MAG: hypothetical protein WBC85_01795 [Planktotalea sp.]|uniref:NYN domain-containing protein n=1 Tax=Planktotalea sp. TaxID=2029877 RepID=UPI003C746A0C